MLIPLYDKIIVKKLSQEERKTISGLYIPDAVTQKEVQALVVAVGEGRILPDGSIRPLAVKVGDKVLLQKLPGTSVMVDGESCYLTAEDNVLGVMR